MSGTLPPFSKDRKDSYHIGCAQLEPENVAKSITWFVHGAPALLSLWLEKVF